MQDINQYYRKDDRSLYVSYQEIQESNSMPHQHFHVGYEVYYLLSGDRYYFIQDRTYHITKGNLVIINTHELHKTAKAGTPGYKRFVINFRDKFLHSENDSTNQAFKKFYERMNQDHCFILNLSVEQQKHMEYLLSLILKEITQKGSGFEAFIQAVLMQLVLTAYRTIEDTFPEKFQYISSKHENASEIIRYINQNFSKPLSITRISDEFFISPYYFSRIFKEATGFTFIEYLNTMRIKESQKLLMNTNLKINQLYNRVGFRSLSQFNRVFKQITGISPREYRKKMY